MKSQYSANYFIKRDQLDLHIAQSIQIIMQDNNLKNVLDVGCGTGRIVQFLNQNGYKAIGIDSAKEAVIAARKYNTHDTIIQSPASKLPFKKSAFDLVISISVIEHMTLADAHVFLTEARRVLCKNGYLFLITPNFASPLRIIQGKKWFGFSDPTHINFYTPKSMKILLQQHKFTEISFRLRSAYNLETNLHLPSILYPLPMFIKNICNYLMVTSFFSTWRDSFWVLAKK